MSQMPPLPTPPGPPREVPEIKFDDNGNPINVIEYTVSADTVIAATTAPPPPSEPPPKERAVPPRAKSVADFDDLPEETQLERLRNFVEDLAHFGGRFDTMPSFGGSLGTHRVHVMYQQYLERIEHSLRESARTVLDAGRPAPSKPPKMEMASDEMVDKVITKLAEARRIPMTQAETHALLDEAWRALRMVREDKKRLLGIIDESAIGMPARSFAKGYDNAAEMAIQLLELEIDRRMDTVDDVIRDERNDNPSLSRFEDDLFYTGLLLALKRRIERARDNIRQNELRRSR